MQQDVSSPHWVERRHPRSGDLCQESDFGSAVTCTKRALSFIGDVISY